MNVLSLFDGVSSGLNALERAGIPVTNYFAAEIDKYADAVSRFNHRNAVRLGCVVKLRQMLEAGLELPVDLLIGGSPCQNLSMAGNGKGLEGESSSLFYEFVKIRDILRARNPNLLFMLENVIPRKKEWTAEMSKFMGVEPVRISYRRKTVIAITGVTGP